VLGNGFLAFAGAYVVEAGGWLAHVNLGSALIALAGFYLLTVVVIQLNLERGRTRRDGVNRAQR
jgi:hypothetical protein